MMHTGLFGMNRKPAIGKSCEQAQTHRPATASAQNLHFGLPKTIAEAQELGWTFELVGDVNGKRAIDAVAVKGTSPNGAASKMFKEHLIDTPFYTARTITEALKLGWTFELVGTVEGKGRLAPVEVKFTSPLGLSKTFTMLFGATPFCTEPAVAPQKTPHRKPGLTPIEQAQRKAAKAAEARELRRSMKGPCGKK